MPHPLYPQARAPAQHDDITVLDCPTLNDLGGDAATGGSLEFPRQAKATFTRSGGSDSEVSEELYSDTAGTLDFEHPPCERSPR
ncbi:hypothetical protein [Streptomyces sp. NPDC088246]|uniref:hypothetical protein n=1 Tax=Streptomyces sp. NPDC088246 TaxID=3365842 RepID=UPI00382D1821